MKSKRIWRTTATGLALVLCGLTAGCAGDLGDAQRVAKKAAGFTGDMHRVTKDSIATQSKHHEQVESVVAALNVGSQVDLADTKRHVATWQGDKSDDSEQLLKAMVALTSDAEITKSAPFVLMAPLPEFSPPAVDDKTFRDVVAKFNKLSQGLSPIERAKALIPFVQAIVKSYKQAKALPQPAMAPVAAGQEKAIPVGVQTTVMQSALTNQSLEMLAAAKGKLKAKAVSNNDRNNAIAAAAAAMASKPAAAISPAPGAVPTDEDGLIPEAQLVNGLIGAMSQ